MYSFKVVLGWTKMEEDMLWAKLTFVSCKSKHVLIRLDQDRRIYFWGWLSNAPRLDYNILISHFSKKKYRNRFSAITFNLLVSNFNNIKRDPIEFIRDIITAANHTIASNFTTFILRYPSYQFIWCLFHERCSLYKTLRKGHNNPA